MGTKGLKWKRTKEILFLQITVLIFALASVSSKFASNYMEQEGLFSLPCIMCLGMYGILMLVYAMAWQKNLENFELSFLYTNRSFYMIWSQIFAVIVFHDTIYFNNVMGLLLIFMGVWVNSKDA